VCFRYFKFSVKARGEVGPGLRYISPVMYEEPAGLRPEPTYGRHLPEANPLANIKTNNWEVMVDQWEFEAGPDPHTGWRSRPGDGKDWSPEYRVTNRMI
jgi:hypothetical protein